jgi:hypothetical protein
MAKKRILILATIILSFSLFSCRSFQYAMINEEEVAETHFQKIIDALESKDKEGLKKVFAPNALKEAKDIDSNIDAVMELYQGRMKSKSDAASTEDIKNDGVRTKQMKCSYMVETDSGYYSIYFIDHLIDSKDAGNVGVYIIKVIQEEKEPEYFYWGDETDRPGVFYEAIGSKAVPSAGLSG